MKAKIKSVKIRLAKAEDISKINKLSRRFREIIGTNNSQYSDREIIGTNNSQYSDEVIYYYKDEIGELIKDRKNNIWLVAVIEKGKRTKMVGFLFAKLMSSDWCYIDSVGVTKEFRSQGIGAALYCELVKVCKKRKISYLQALADMKNKNGRKFWKNMGFKEGKTLTWLDREL